MLRDLAGLLVLLLSSCASSPEIPGSVGSRWSRRKPRSGYAPGGGSLAPSWPDARTEGQLNG